jgi:Flp pilus assembly protein TadB
MGGLRADGMRLWLIAVAAVMAAVVVIESVGLMAGVGLGSVCLGGIFGYRFYRARNLAKGLTVYCLRCGEALPATARGCKYCGSASWTMRQ